MRKELSGGQSGQYVWRALPSDLAHSSSALVPELGAEAAVPPAADGRGMLALLVWEWGFRSRRVTFPTTPSLLQNPCLFVRC